MIEMVYLNKNISKQEADELVNQGQKIRKSLSDKLLSNAKTIKDKGVRANYISSCLPFITMI